MTITQIIDSWLEARNATNRSNSMTSQDCNLFSYNLLIARYSWSDDHPVVFNYTRQDGGKYVSHTTSSHITKVWDHLISKNYTPTLEQPEC